MAYNHEDLTIWTIASISKYFKSREFGVPVILGQQAKEKDAPTPSNLQIIVDGPDFNRKGTKNERYGVVHVRIFVNTTYVPTDIYHHTRLKAKAAEAMQHEIPLLRIGSPTYDKMIVGFLRPLPTESIMITVTSIEEPDASLVEGSFCLELC